MTNFLALSKAKRIQSDHKLILLIFLKSFTHFSYQAQLIKDVLL